jgi:hypothetical protein
VEVGVAVEPDQAEVLGAQAGDDGLLGVAVAGQHDG